MRASSAAASVAVNAAAESALSGAIRAMRTEMPASDDRVGVPTTSAAPVLFTRVAGPIGSARGAPKKGTATVRTPRPAMSIGKPTMRPDRRLRTSAVPKPGAPR